MISNQKYSHYKINDIRRMIRNALFIFLPLFFAGCDSVDKADSVAASSNARNLAILFSSFNQCEFQHLHYDETSRETIYDTGKLPDLQPYKTEQSLAFYHTNSVLFEMPVSHITLPITWGLVSITFDLPIDEVRPKLEKFFGENFESKNPSDYGFKPILVPNRDNPSKTVLYCDEPEISE